ncbi:MAG: ribonuclease HII [Bacillota bacterium]|nr:ribonuclease HII [Bacillota bacterium]
MTDLYVYESELRQNGIKNLCGIDEAGRGPLAGPVFAAAVILPEGLVIDGLNDSKKLSEKKRELLYEIICEKALAYGVASCDEHLIDEINILNASMLAMERAVSALALSPDFIIVDGNRTPQNLPCESEAIIGGDGKCASIAAASVLAKVSRDRYMKKLAKLYPQYDFEQHKGYPTKLHYERIKENGISPVHRKTFLKNLSEK